MQRLKKRIIIETLIITCVFSFIFWILQKNTISLGIFIGAITAIICFQLLAKNIQTSLTVSALKVKPYFFLKYLIRYVIMGGVLFLCAKADLQIFLGAALGLLMIYVVIFLDSFTINKECRIPAK